LSTYIKPIGGYGRDLVARWQIRMELLSVTLNNFMKIVHKINCFDRGSVHVQCLEAVEKDRDSKHINHCKRCVAEILDVDNWT